MKPYYSKKHECYIVEECGKPICTAPTLYDAQRLMGIEPEDDEPLRGPSEGQEDDGDELIFE